MRTIIPVVLIAAVVLLSACTTPTAAPTTVLAPTTAPGATARPTSAPTAAPTEPGLSGQLSVAGSTSVQPLAETLAQAFEAANPQVNIDVQGGGSSVGIKSAGDGTVDIGTASRNVKDEELQEYPDLVVTTIARDGIAVVVHPGVAVESLTKEQVRDIFAGVITNWKEVGGADKPIIVVSREEGSGTRSAFQDMVMGGEEPPIVDTAILQPSTGALLTTVASTPDSIGYISFGYLDESVKALYVDGIAPTAENALNGTYPIVRPFNMVTKGAPTGLAKAWLDWILSDAGQAIVTDEGYIPLSGAVTSSGPSLSGQLSVAGSTSVQPLAEALAGSFEAIYPDVQIDVQGGGSSVGVKSAGDGTVDIGTASRNVKDEELQEYPDLVVTTIARDGIAVIVHPGVAVEDLTKEQVRDIFAGVITNWSEVGGADKPIIVVSREEGSGTRSAFQDMVMGGEEPPIVATAILQPSNGAVRTTVASTPDSIGYISFGYLDDSVKALAINGVAATAENAINGTYPIVRPFNMVTKGAPTGLAKIWLDYILGSVGQAVVADEGYLPPR